MKKLLLVVMIGLSGGSLIYAAENKDDEQVESLQGIRRKIDRLRGTARLVQGTPEEGSIQREIEQLERDFATLEAQPGDWGSVDDEYDIADDKSVTLPERSKPLSEADQKRIASMQLSDDGSDVRAPIPDVEERLIGGDEDVQYPGMQQALADSLVTQEAPTSAAPAKREEKDEEEVKIKRGKALPLPTNKKVLKEVAGVLQGAGPLADIVGEYYYSFPWKDHQQIELNGCGGYNATRYYRVAISALAISPNNQFGVIGSYSGLITVWSKGGKILAQQEMPAQPHSTNRLNAVKSIVISPDGQRIAVLYYSKIVRLFKLEKDQLGTFTLSNVLKSGYYDDISRKAYSIAMSQDGESLIVGSDGWISTLRTSDGQSYRIPGMERGESFGEFHSRHERLAHNQRLSPPQIRSLAIDNKNQFIVAGAFKDANALVLSTGGKLIAELPGEGYVSAVAISENSDYIVTAFSTGKVIVWSSKGEKLHELNGHTAGATHIVIMRDGEHIITGSGDFILLASEIHPAHGDNTVRIWNKNGTLLHTIQEKESINSLALGGQDSYLIIGSGATTELGQRDSFVKMFDLHGKFLAYLPGKRAAMSDDGQWIITGGTEDDTAWIFSPRKQVSGIKTPEQEILEIIRTRRDIIKKRREDFEAGRLKGEVETEGDRKRAVDRVDNWIAKGANPEALTANDDGRAAQPLWQIAERELSEKHPITERLKRPVVERIARERERQELQEREEQEERARREQQEREEEENNKRRALLEKERNERVALQEREEERYSAIAYINTLLAQIDERRYAAAIERLRDELNRLDITHVSSGQAIERIKKRADDEFQVWQEAVDRERMFD